MLTTDSIVDDIARLAAEYTPQEVAQRLHTSVETVLYVLATGQLPKAQPQWADPHKEK